MNELRAARTFIIVPGPNKEVIPAAILDASKFPSILSLKASNEEPITQPLDNLNPENTGEISSDKLNMGVKSASEVQKENTYKPFSGLIIF